MLGAGTTASIVMASAFVAVWPSLVTSTSKFPVPTAVGMPLISPAAFRARPAGRVVELNIAHV